MAGSQCRACGHPTMWVTTERGSRMQVVLVGEAQVLSEDDLSVSTAKVVVYHRCRDADVRAHSEGLIAARKQRERAHERAMTRKEEDEALRMTRAKEREAQWEATLGHECPKCLAEPGHHCVNLARRAKGMSDEPTRWPHAERFVHKDP